MTWCTHAPPGLRKAPARAVCGADASQTKATADNPTVSKYRPLFILAEDPMSKRDLQDRVDREQAQRIGISVQASITVQGWFRPDGTLWEPAEIPTVRSPSLFPNPSGAQTLAVQTVTYKQDPKQGATTTLDVVLPQAMADVRSGAPKDGAPNMFQPGNKPAQPR